MRRALAGPLPGAAFVAAVVGRTPGSGRSSDSFALGAAGPHRLNHALWGGRFNPLLPLERTKHARQLAGSFRVDVVLPLGGAAETVAFAESFRHLHNPLHGEGAFTDGAPSGTIANVLDVHNLFSYAYQKREDRELRRSGARLYTWSQDDPLADMFLMHLGQYPAADQIDITAVPHTLK